MYSAIPRDLLEVIEPIVRDHGLEVVDAAPPVGGKSRRLHVILDTPEGDGRVTLDECAAVSREIGHALDASDLIHGAYVLEISSPGIDRVLGREKDFERAQGRKVSIDLAEPLDGRRHFRGELVMFEQKEMCVETESGRVRIPFDQVARAKAFYPAEEGEASRGQKR
jgi:ribosome maturation factor RimP